MKRVMLYGLALIALGGIAAAGVWQTALADIDGDQSPETIMLVIAEPGEGSIPYQYGPHCFLSAFNVPRTHMGIAEFGEIFFDNGVRVLDTGTPKLDYNNVVSYQNTLFQEKQTAAAGGAVVTIWTNAPYRLERSVRMNNDLAEISYRLYAGGELKGKAGLIAIWNQGYSTAASAISFVDQGWQQYRAAHADSFPPGGAANGTGLQLRFKFDDLMQGRSGDCITAWDDCGYPISQAVWNLGLLAQPDSLTMSGAGACGQTARVSWLFRQGQSVAAIGVAPATLSPQCVQGSAAPSQSFEVWNQGGGTLSYSISTDAAWLSCEPQGGISAGEHDTVAVSCRSEGLAAGVHSGTITVSANGAGPVQVPVTLTVTPAAILAQVRITPRTINVNANGVFTARIAVPPPHAATDIAPQSVTCAGAHAQQWSVSGREMTAHFNRADIRSLPSGRQPLTVAGDFSSGGSFSGADTVTISHDGMTMGKTTLSLSITPNPFSSTTSFSFENAPQAPGSMTVSIYNVAGQRIRTITADGPASAATWDARDEQGRQVRTGIYVYRASIGAQQRCGRLVYLR